MQHLPHLPAPRRRRTPSTRPRSVQPRSTALVWRSPERHLWVATGDGEYAGMTQYDRRVGYTATGPTAAPLGRYRSLDEAKAAIESAEWARFMAPLSRAAAC